MKAITSFVPVFKLIVKGFDNIVRNIVFKACNMNMLNAKDSLSWYFKTTEKSGTTDSNGKVAPSVSVLLIIYYLIRKGMSDEMEQKNGTAEL